jgi:hypothetical protein
LIVFETEAIPYLIGSTDVNEKLAEGPKGAFSLLRSLCGVLRYEYTTHGVKAVVIGASALPEYLYIPGELPDEDEYSDDDSHAHSVLHDEAMEALNAAKRKAEEEEQEVIMALEAAREAKESERRKDAEEERLAQERKTKFTASVKVSYLLFYNNRVVQICAIECNSYRPLSNCCECLSFPP